MGTRVYAWVELGPWDEKQVAATEDGERLLGAIEGLGFSERRTEDTDGVVILRCSDSEVNYGTAFFEQEEIGNLAQATGLWWAWGDEGSTTWDASYEVGSPSGKHWSFLGEYGNPAVDAKALKKLQERHGGDNDKVMAEVLVYMALGRRSLAEWITEGEPDDESTAAP